MVEEVRRQFKEIKGILTGEAQPDYARCVEISTKGAQHEMVLPSVLAIIAPILTGLIFGVTGVVGLLIGGLSTGFVLAVFMATPEEHGITRRNSSRKETTAARVARRIRQPLSAIRLAIRSKTLPARV